MAKVVWLDQAREDVRSILDYLASENPPAAAKYVAGLTGTCSKLVAFPRSGRRYNAAFRCVVFRNHLIFYGFDEPKDEVRIAAVIDGRRDLKELIGEPGSSS